MPFSIASAAGHAASAVGSADHASSEELGRVFKQTIQTVEPDASKVGGKRKAATLTDPGTYAYREQEKKRVGIQTGSGTHESEHVYGYHAVHPDVGRKTQDGKALEGSMPAYHEVRPLHRAHAGTGSGGLNSEESAWSHSDDYRRDQAATLADPVARRQGTSVSNGYQLNQLGYAHQLASGGHQYSGPASNYGGPGGAEAMNKANESYATMVQHDPAIAHNFGGARSDQLGSKGQAEVVLAREIALSGNWPSRGRQNEVFMHFDEQADRSNGVRRR
jgi:hypothetical protein